MNGVRSAAYAAYVSSCQPVFDCPSDRPETVTALPEGYTVRTRHFLKQLDYVIHASESVLLDREGRVLYTWRNLNDDAEFVSLFRHSSGRHCLVFRRDLYGYSVLEVETGRDFHLIPRQAYPEAGEKFEEAFIWTGANYDPVSNLLAASGCYWAGPGDVLLMDFSEPLAEHPWVELHQVLDPDYDLYDDIDFDRWDGEGGVLLQAFSTQTMEPVPLHLPAKRLRHLMRGKRIRRNEDEKEEPS